MDKETRVLLIDTRARLAMIRARIAMLDYEKDPNPENWRTINGSKVHLTNGRIDGGAGGLFNGNDWTGKIMHKQDPRSQSRSLFGGGFEVNRTEEEISNSNRIFRRARKRKERYEEKKAAGLEKQRQVAAERKRKEEERKNRIPQLSPWELSPEELRQERERLEKAVNAEYWRFSRSLSSRRGYNAEFEQRLKQVKAAMGEREYPWQWNKSDAKRLIGVPEKKHKEYVKKAIEQGLPVPNEVLADYPDLQESIIPF